MKTVELEFLLANHAGVGDIETFTVRPNVDILPDGVNGDIRITNSDNHIHLYHNGWQDLGEFEDERMDKVDQVIVDLEEGNFINKDEAKEVISDLSEEIFVPMSDEDIDKILNGGA